MDSNALTFKGAVGRLVWGYHEAASLSSWTFTPDHEGGGRLTATVIQQDTFRASQRPLMFTVPRPTGEPWRWSVQSLQIAGGALTATLGPQE